MIPFLGEAIAMPDAVAALRTALRDGLDPEADWVRSSVRSAHGELLLMPSEWGRYVGFKLVTVAPANPARGRPRIQGTYLLHDAETLTPLAMLDGTALTAVRTAAVSALAVDALAVPAVSRLVVFGTGPQARSHIAAVRAVRPVEEVAVIGRDAGRTREFASSVDARIGAVADVAHADVVVCATTARTPLFDGALLSNNATVVAVGSHEHSAREVDDATVAASTVVVEARSAALREAGDVTQPVRAGVLDPDTLVDLASVVLGTVEVAMDRPRLFKSVGMAWEDLVIAADSWERRQ
ncbi:ornithine cyclodeaminase family protein [Actinophytocola sp.]|uniref:ornithine cyclodeaminase family protein n=1 Tax=Actinophytocola sp. TaxID=1872138 RepID=UPI002ED5D4CD